MEVSLLCKRLAVLYAATFTRLEMDQTSTSQAEPFFLGIYRGHQPCKACPLPRVSSQPSTSDSPRGSKHVHLPQHCPGAAQSTKLGKAGFIFQPLLCLLNMLI